MENEPFEDVFSIENGANVCFTRGYPLNSVFSSSGFLWLPRLRVLPPVVPPQPPQRHLLISSTCPGPKVIFDRWPTRNLLYPVILPAATSMLWRSLAFEAIYQTNRWLMILFPKLWFRIRESPKHSGLGIIVLCADISKVVRQFFSLIFVCWFPSLAIPDTNLLVGMVKSLQSPNMEMSQT